MATIWVIDACEYRGLRWNARTKQTLLPSPRDLKQITHIAGRMAISLRGTEILILNAGLNAGLTESHSGLFFPSTLEVQATILEERPTIQDFVIGRELVHLAKWSNNLLVRDVALLAPLYIADVALTRFVLKPSSPRWPIYLGGAVFWVWLCHQQRRFSEFRADRDTCLWLGTTAGAKEVLTNPRFELRGSGWGFPTREARLERICAFEESQRQFYSAFCFPLQKNKTMKQAELFLDTESKTSDKRLRRKSYRDKIACVRWAPATRYEAKTFDLSLNKNKNWDRIPRELADHWNQTGISVAGRTNQTNSKRRDVCRTMYQQRKSRCEPCLQDLHEVLARPKRVTGRAANIIHNSVNWIPREHGIVTINFATPTFGFTRIVLELRSKGLFGLAFSPVEQKFHVTVSVQRGSEPWQQITDSAMTKKLELSVTDGCLFGRVRVEFHGQLPDNNHLLTVQVFEEKPKLRPELWLEQSAGSVGSARSRVAEFMTDRGSRKYQPLELRKMKKLRLRSLADKIMFEQEF